MKKFITLLMVVALIVAMSVPAFASTMSYNGQVLPDIDTVWTDKETYPYAFIRYSSGSVISLIVSMQPWYVNSSGTKAYTKTSTYYVYSLKDGVWNLIKSYYDNGALDISALVWTSSDIYADSKLSEVYFEGTTPEVSACDGSACPATDANFDGFCDDCGMRLMSLVRNPSPPAVTGSNINSVMFSTGEGWKYTVYTSDVAYTIRGEIYGTRYRANTEPSVNVVTYESYDGINWNQTYSGKSASSYPGEVGYTLLSSTFTWYDEGGEPFFPVPLWKEMGALAQGEMGVMILETMETMKILMVCGIGCLALLTVLVLFGKRSLIFRG